MKTKHTLLISSLLFTAVLCGTLIATTNPVLSARAGTVYTCGSVNFGMDNTTGYTYMKSFNSVKSKAITDDNKNNYYTTDTDLLNIEFTRCYYNDFNQPIRFGDSDSKAPDYACITLNFASNVKEITMWYLPSSVSTTYYLKVNGDKQKVYNKNDLTSSDMPTSSFSDVRMLSHKFVLDEGSKNVEITTESKTTQLYIANITVKEHD